MTVFAYLARAPIHECDRTLLFESGLVMIVFFSVIAIIHDLAATFRLGIAA